MFGFSPFTLRNQHVTALPPAFWDAAIAESVVDATVAIRGRIVMDQQLVRASIEMIESYCPVRLHIGPSAGATCLLCESAIHAGALQYNIGVGRSTIIVDENCYMSSLRECVEATPVSADHPLRV